MIGILVTDHNVRETLKITDRSYLIKDGRVRTQGTPQQIIHDPIAIQEYLGAGFVEDGFHALVTPPPAASAAPAAAAVHLVLEQEKVHRLIEALRGPGQAGAAAELLQRGRTAVPVLLEALERRDVELRRQAFTLLQRLFGGGLLFDPFAPESQRRQQIAHLRERFERKAS